MKTHRNFLLVIALLMIALTSFAQKHEPPAWLSDKGSWMVEGNLRTPRHHIIHFYNNQGVEVYKEELKGVRLQLKSVKTKMRLKQVLESSVLAWEQSHLTRKNEALVINSFRRK